MTKKIVIGLVLSMVITAVSFAQYAQIMQFVYAVNFSEEQFTKFGSPFNQKQIGGGDGWFRLEKLHNSIIQAIDYNLHGYSLDIGDVFMCKLMYSGRAYFIMLRVTDTRNLRWQFYAWSI